MPISWPCSGPVGTVPTRRCGCAFRPQMSRQAGRVETRLAVFREFVDSRSRVPYDPAELLAITSWLQTHTLICDAGMQPDASHVVPFSEARRMEDALSGDAVLE